MICVCVPRLELGTRAEARTKEADRALSMDADYILFMDTDQTMPDDALERMKALNVDIAVIDTPPHDSDMVNATFSLDGNIEYCTIACSLIRADVFRRMDKPWFSSAYDFVPTNISIMGRSHYKMLDKSKDNNVGEDIYFVRKAIEAGFSIDIITDERCNHYSL